MRDCLAYRRGGFKGHSTDMWNIIPHCLVRCIWTEHNSWSFEGIESLLLQLKFFFMDLFMMSWIKNIGNSSSSFLDFVVLCNF